MTKVDNKIVQRHVFPLYKKDSLGGYVFSSSMTHITFKGCFFLVFAEHALSNGENTLDKIGVIGNNGRFSALSDLMLSYKIYSDLDLVVVQIAPPIATDNRRFFDINTDDSVQESDKNLYWIGFPAKKSKNFHNSKASPEAIKENYIEDVGESSMKGSHAQFLIVAMKQESLGDVVIKGAFSNKGVNYLKEGFKSKGYSVKGMSGGALYKYYPSLKEELYFMGIGLQYDNKKIMRGASRVAIKRVITEFLENEETMLELS